VKLLKSKKFWIVFVTVLLVLGAGGGYYYWQQKKHAEEVDASLTVFDWEQDTLTRQTKEVDEAEFTFVGGVWVKNSNPEIGTRDLKDGDQGEDVKVLQKVLNDLREESKDNTLYFEEVPTDGKFEAKTEKAVKVMQEAFGQDQTGVADQDFIESLFDALSEREARDEA
jgi:peptidoglycan hydrolase-like protein with peptidoglycan-binding domain